MMPYMEMFKNEFNNPLNNNFGQDFSNVNSQKMYVLFSDIKGLRINLILNKSTTLDEALKIYLKRIGKPELIHTDKIYFICDARKIKFGDKTKIEELGFECP